MQLVVRLSEARVPLKALQCYMECSGAFCDNLVFNNNRELFSKLDLSPWPGA